MRSLTVVFEIHDEQSFKPEIEKMKEIFFADGDVNKVVAMGQGNEITRIELIEQAIQEVGTFEVADCVREILSMSSNNPDFYEEGLKVIKSWVD